MVHRGKVSLCLVALAVQGATGLVPLARRGLAARRSVLGNKALRSQGAVHLRSAAVEEQAAVAPGPTPKEALSLVSTGTTNLVKSIVGAGVLALPAGIAAFADANVALFPATILMAALGAASAYTFGILGRVCGAYGASTYKEAWSKSVGEKTAFIVDFACTLTPLLACLSYSMIIGDAFAALIASAKPGPSVVNALGLLGGARRSMVAIITLLVLWPLCSLKSLKALAPTSALGMVGVVYTMGFMGLRAVDGTYAAGGALAEALAASGATLPQFGTKTIARPAGLGVFVAMLGTAFMAHFNAPSFFKEAARDSKVFSTVVSRGFGLSVLINIAIMCAGFLTFGASSNGLILNNYAATDGLAALARALFGVSIVFTFPLAYAGSKDGIRQVLANLGWKNEASREKAVVAAPLAIITALALVLKDVGVVVSFTGALMGSAIIYVLPALMLLKADKLQRSKLEKKAIPLVLGGLGAASGAIGVYTTLA